MMLSDSSDTMEKVLDKQQDTIFEDETNTENDINEQRNQFISISNAMINSVKAFGVNNVSYELYCPMADDDKGAFWLSTEKQVINPYFGDMMLRCGEVKDTIQ